MYILIMLVKKNFFIKNFFIKNLPSIKLSNYFNFFIKIIQTLIFFLIGGDISDKIIPLMCHNSKVILCGQISDYEKTDVYPPPLAQNIIDILKSGNIQRERYLGKK